MKLSNKYFNISLIIDNMLNKLDEEMEKFINHIKILKLRNTLAKIKTVIYVNNRNRYKDINSETKG